MVKSISFKYDVFIPAVKGRCKTNLRGFWKNENGKIFYDYMNIENYNTIDNNILSNIQKEYNQEAIFYIDNEGNKANIFFNDNNIDILKSSVTGVLCSKKNLKNVIKRMIQKYNGVTVKMQGLKYILTSWTK